MDDSFSIVIAQTQSYLAPHEASLFQKVTAVVLQTSANLTNMAIAGLMSAKFNHAANLARIVLKPTLAIAYQDYIVALKYPLAI